MPVLEAADFFLSTHTHLRGYYRVFSQWFLFATINQVQFNVIFAALSFREVTILDGFAQETAA